MSAINIKVITSFGCVCCNMCHCQVCGKGRQYNIVVRNTDSIDSIWEEMSKQNIKIKEKQVTPALYFKKELLDFDRRVINYDLAEGSEIICVMPPQLCCIRDFRKPPKNADGVTESENDETLERKPQKRMDSGAMTTNV